MRGVTILWALRSPCNLHCQYCYFGTVGGPYDRTKTEGRPGELSHVGRTDVSCDAMLDFIATFTPHLVHRVFIAGGEPLIWGGTVRVLSALKAAGCEVIVCTNGLPLVKDSLSHTLLDLQIDAVSISLDSYDPVSNDHWRQDRSGQGWHGVVAGLQTLVRLRNQRQAQTRIGVYSVITQQTIGHILQTGRMVADMGADSYIVQPISLAPDHPLFSNLSLDGRHRQAFAQAIMALHTEQGRLSLPHPGYVQQVFRTLTADPLPVIENCFGGRDLFFLEPDGSLWDCPSMYKIAATPPEQRLSLVGNSAQNVFSTARRGRNTDCCCFSQDCVNMWQIMSFDDILYQQGGTPYAACPR
ncbi:MAG: radical SAM protein [Ktedonobacteraceae bacterium]